MASTKAKVLRAKSVVSVVLFALTPPAGAEKSTLPDNINLHGFLPDTSEFPPRWTVGETDAATRTTSVTQDGLLARFGQHATPRNCYPDSLVFLSASGVARGGKPGDPARGSYIIVTLARPEKNPTSRGFTGTLRYWGTHCSEFSVTAIPGWSGPLRGSIRFRSVPVLPVDSVVALRVTEYGSSGEEVGVTAIAARLRDVDILVTGYPGADETLVDTLLRSTVKKIDEWEG